MYSLTLRCPAVRPRGLTGRVSFPATGGDITGALQLHRSDRRGVFTAFDCPLRPHRTWCGRRGVSSTFSGVWPHSAALRSTRSLCKRDSPHTASALAVQGVARELPGLPAVAGCDIRRPFEPCRGYAMKDFAE